MIVFILGISITLNIVFIILFLFIYKYSLKGMTSKIEKEFIKSYNQNLEDNFDIEEVHNVY